MEFPPEWAVLPSEDFEVAVPRDPGPLGMELMAQVRPSGRIMDHFRISLGGARQVGARFNTRSIFNNNSIVRASIHYDVWARDINIRRNMTTSEWLDLANLVAANDVLVYKPSEEAGSSQAEAPLEELCNDEIVAFLNGLSEKTHCGASVRWAVGMGADRKLELILQGLPASAAVLTGKPIFRG